MEYAHIAMKNAFNYRIYLVLLLLGCILICILFPGKSERKQRVNAIYLVVCSVILVAYLLYSIPFLKEYHAKNIVVERGVYMNLLGGRKSAPSAIAGVYSVTLKTEEGKIGLSTAPGCKDVFLQGEYEVVAYYFPDSKILLHIEILK